MATATAQPHLRLCVPSELNPPLNVMVVEDRNGLDRVADFLARVKVFGIDTETNMTETFYHRRVRTIQLGDRNEQYLIDTLPFAGNSTTLISSMGHYGRNGASTLFAPIIDVLKPALESRDWLKVGANLEFEYIILKWCFGLRPWNFFDNLLAEKVLYAGEVGFFERGFWALDDMVARYLGLNISKDEQKRFDLETPLTQSQIDYCGLDARLPISIMGVQMKKLAHEGLTRAAQIEFNAVPAFGDMHLNGMAVDESKWLALNEQNRLRKAVVIAKMDETFIPLVGRKEMPPAQEELDALEKVWKDTKDKEERKVARQAYMTRKKLVTEFKARMKKGSDVYEGEAALNYGSAAQMRDALRCIKGYTKSIVPDTNDETLNKLSTLPTDFDVDDIFEKDPALAAHNPVDLLRVVRSFDKRIGTYGREWLSAVDPDTKRIHSRFNQLGAATGRPTSEKPNLYNLPKSKLYRSCFVAGIDTLILKQDCSGQELRILTEYSQEPVWLQAFNNGWDLHSVCADLLLGDKWKLAAEATCRFIEKKIKCSCKTHTKFRDWIKSVNFGLAYGMTARRLSSELKIAFTEAEALLTAFYRSFPVVIAYLTRSGQDAARTMESRTLSGRRRRFKKPTWEHARAVLLKALKHEPSSNEINKKLKGMFASIEREGKNTPIQGSGADWMKEAMGCGFDSNGQPYMWHRLEPEFDGKLINFVYDEFVTEAHKDRAPAQYAMVGDCIVRAGMEFITSVPVEWDGTMADCWTK